MPNSVPPLPWNTGWRTPSNSEGGAGPNRGGSPPSGGAGGSGGASAGGVWGEAGGTARGPGPLPGGAGLRKNDGRPVGSCPSIPPDYGWKLGNESTFGRVTPRANRPARSARGGARRGPRAARSS